MTNMYNQKFVATIVVNGNIVPETENGEIFLKSGTEYKIRLRNKNNRRAVAEVSIDGEKVLGEGVVIPGNSFVEIERGIDVAKKFKFVALDSEEAQDFGKDTFNKTGEMGVISVVFRLEKEKPNVVITSGPSKRLNTFPNPTDRFGGPIGTPRGINHTYSNTSLSAKQTINESHQSFAASAGGSSMDWATEDCMMGLSANIQPGCTVEGGHSSQTFREVSVDLEPIGYTVHLTLKATNKESAVLNEIRLLEAKAKAEYAATQAKIEELRKSLS